MADRASVARRRRAERAAALRKLELGRVSITDVLRSPPDALLTCPLWTVLLRCPQLGEAGARSMCERAQVWPLSCMHELTRWQRYVLIQLLPARVK